MDATLLQFGDDVTLRCRRLLAIVVDAAGLLQQSVHQVVDVHFCSSSREHTIFWVLSSNTRLMIR